MLISGAGTYRLVDDHVLMAIPELYRYGREGKWFGVKLFTVFMTEGVVQVGRKLCFNSLTSDVCLAVRHYLLHSPLRLFLSVCPERWIRCRQLRVFDGDGHLRSYCIESLQRSQYKGLDRLGVFLRVYWHYSHLGIHRTSLSFHPRLEL
jgi:hypothetical protein